MFLDPADIIPGADDSDDEEEGAVVPSATLAVVIGAGPVGLITAAYLARRGFRVEVHESGPNPALGPRPNSQYPMVLTQRALLAFKELGMRVSFAGPGATPHRGTYDMSHAGGAGGGAASSGPVLRPGKPGDAYRSTAVVGRAQLEGELLAEIRRLWPHRVTVHYGSTLKRIDWDAKAVVVEAEGAPQGAPLSASSDRALRGNSLFAGAARPPSAKAAVDPLLPELGGAAGGGEVAVPYGLLVGADGANSRVRDAMIAAKTRVRQFEAQRPYTDTDAWKTFTGLPQALPQEPVPGFSGHQQGEYLYEWGYAVDMGGVARPAAEGVPRLRMWVSGPGQLSGVITGVTSWEAGDLGAALKSAYGGSLPDAWRQAIVAQACGPAAPPPVTSPATVQCSQMHGPRIVLVGDAAHAASGDLGQGFNCAVEGVRVLNLALKASKDNLDKAPIIYSEVRGEDAHCMQQLECFQRSLRGGIKWGDLIFAFGGFCAATVMRSALLMLRVLSAVMPARFPSTWFADAVTDARRGYADILKVTMRFAVGPILALIGVMAVAVRCALAANGTLPW